MDNYGERGARNGGLGAKHTAGPEAEPLVGVGGEAPLKLKGFVIGTPRREAKVDTSESNWSPFPAVSFLILFGQFS